MYYIAPIKINYKYYYTKKKFKLHTLLTMDIKKKTLTPKAQD